MKTDPHTTAQNVSTKIQIDNLVNGSIDRPIMNSL